MKLRGVTNEISEKDDSGSTISYSVRRDKTIKNTSTPSPHVQHSGNSNDKITVLSARYNYQDATVEFLKRVFLPKGYPDSVPPDYTRYQIYNALQAFCNSLASLIASRALLEGQGIGNASASATDALLLNVFLDVFGRVTEITSAHLLGTSLVPDAKRYRLLADILNDAALVLDTISPLFNAYGVPSLRIVALCLSACFRALCGIVAGGSKAAIAMHFATPSSGKGDIGDLNAKDMSKQTVLALFGMLLGSLVVPRLTTTFATYTALFILIGAHIGINYLGVQCLVLRTMNHERLWTSWFLFNENKDEPNFTPELVNSLERVFPMSKSDLFILPFPIPGLPRTVSLINPLKMETLTTFRNPVTQEVIGYVTVGSSFSEILKEPLHPELISEFQHWTDFVLWFDDRCLVYPDRNSGLEKDEEDEQRSPVLSRAVPPHVHICFKERSTPGSRVQAWLAAGLLCKSVSEIHASSRPSVIVDAYSIFLGTIQSSSRYDKDQEWKVDEMVWKLCKPRRSGGSQDEGGGGLWRKWKRCAEGLGWDVGSEGGEGRAKGRQENVSVEGEGNGEVGGGENVADYGSELGVTVPEPKSLIVSLGYSYETKKIE